jgi:hypothetical protein
MLFVVGVFPAYAARRRRLYGVLSCQSLPARECTLKLHGALCRCLPGETQVQKTAPLEIKKLSQLGDIASDPSRLITQGVGDKYGHWGFQRRQKGAMRLLQFILGAFAAIVCIASPASAQYASQSDRSISVHHRKNLRTSTHQSGSRAFTSPPTEIPRDPRTWVGDPAGRPYVYVPGMASGGQ